MSEKVEKEKYKPKVTSWVGDNRPPEKRYAEFDYWEDYDDDKEYQEEPFEANYGIYHGQQTYKWWPQTSDWSSNVPMWMIAKLYATPEEVKALAPYCACTVCNNIASKKKSFLGRCYMGIAHLPGRHAASMLYLWIASCMFLAGESIFEFMLPTPFMWLWATLAIGLPVSYFVGLFLGMSMRCAGCYGCIKNGHADPDEQPREYILRGARANRDRLQDQKKLN